MTAKTDELVAQIRSLDAEDKKLAEIIAAFEEPWEHISIPDGLVDVDLNGAAFRAEASSLRASAEQAEQIAAQLDVMEKNAKEAEAARDVIGERLSDLNTELWGIDEDLFLSLDAELNG
jgi:hypothetical protein